MKAAILAQAMGNRWSLTDYERYAPGFNEAMLAAGCTTVRRAAMWCAQLGHESAGLLYMEEIASGSAYEGRADLGNTQAGDGVRFKGRGPIQVTGRANYTAVSAWAYAHDLVPTARFFVDNPAQLASDRYGFIGPVWYWTVARSDINALCDAGDLTTVTRRINGGTNGIDDRRSRYNRCLALGEAILPTEGDTMSYADDELKKQFASRSKYRTSDKPLDTIAGYILNIDARLHEEFVEREALKGVNWCVELVKREAAKGDKGAQAIVDQIGK